MSSENINTDSFFYEAYDILNDCFTMPMHDDQPRANYSSLAPKDFPEHLIVPVQEGLDTLKMYTSGLKVLHANPELCLQKALELLEHDKDYHLALSIFRHDLTQRVTNECEFGEVDALICGIDSLASYLRQYFKEYNLFIGSSLAYVFARYIEPGTLVMTKLMYYNGNLHPRSHSTFYTASKQLNALLHAGS